MNAAADDLRYEVKAACRSLDLPRVRTELQLMSCGLRPLHATRTVQSLYFDTDAGRAVGENLAGISDRRKVRLRFYGEDTDVVQAQLEVKERRAGLGSKRVAKLPPGLRVQGAETSRFPASVLAHFDGTAEECAWWADQLRAHRTAQWIRYRREYWETAAGNVRVTLDSKLEAFDLRYAARINDRAPSPLPAVAVIECKAAASARAAVEALVHALPLSVGRCSKFMLASVPGEGPLLPR